MPCTLIAALALSSFVFITPPARAAAEREVRTMSPAAREQLGWFRVNGQHLLEHGDNAVSRTRAPLGSDLLEQFVIENHSAFMYGIEVGGTPDLFGAVQELAPATTDPAVAYPSVTPWVAVTRGEAAPPIRSDEQISSGTSWYMTPARIQAWRARRYPRDEKLVIAVGRRPVVGREGSGPQLLRVQRYYHLRSMNQKVSVTLNPADPDGAFREVQVKLNQKRGVFRWTGAGEIVGFRATTNLLFVTTTELITQRIAFEATPDGLSFDAAKGRAADASDELRVISSVRAARVRPATPEECAAALAAE